MIAITDRTRNDIINRTNKAFFNVADWTRIDDNSQTVKTAIETGYGITVARITTTTPSVGAFVNVNNINDLVKNIELLRVAAALPEEIGIKTLKHDYATGVYVTAPDYNDINDWERNLLIMDEQVPNAASYRAYCGVPAVGQDRFWQVRFR